MKHTKPVMLVISLAMALMHASAPSSSSPSTIHVCNSGVATLNGVYEIDQVLKSDEVPVFARVDQDGEELTHDYRLFRHQGYWSIADFASWPPEVHFRCDPYINGHEHNAACAKDQDYPPLEGYSPRLPEVSAPVLQIEPCVETKPKIEL